MTDQKVLQSGQSALVHMKLTLEDGTVIQDSENDNKPCLLQLGDESLSQAFESHLVGMAIADNCHFKLPPEDAFGISNPALIQYMDLQQFSKIGKLKVDQLIPFERADGKPMMGRIVKISGQSVTVDFNHPFVDKVIDFEVQLLKIQPDKVSQPLQADK